jgi:ubiquinone/menaquinone biosynthesis C-methylase UbiE
MRVDNVSNRSYSVCMKASDKTMGNEREVQDQITAFWTFVAPQYEAHPGNVPAVESAEYEAWIRAIERVLPARPSDVLDVGTGTGFVALIASQLGHRVTGVDLSTAMLSEAREHAEQRGLRATFTEGDAVAPPLEEESVDAIICRHLLWTLREPQVALMNWWRLLRPRGRIVVIDGFWFAQAKPQEGNEVFDRYYTDRTREALPAMYWGRVEPVAGLLTAAGFSDVTTSDLADVHRLAEKPPSAQPWYVVTGRRSQ